MFIPMLIVFCSYASAFPKHSFTPSIDWVFLNVLNNHLTANLSYVESSEAERDNGRSDFVPCGCPGEPTSYKPPAPAISTQPKSLTLTCDTSAPYEVISWWLFRCPQDGGYKSLMQIAEGPQLYFSGYELRTGQKPNGYFSSLLIKDVGASTSSGLYQCVAHSKNQVEPTFSRSDYFIVGKHENIKECIHRGVTRNAFKRGAEDPGEIQAKIHRWQDSENSTRKGWIGMENLQNSKVQNSSHAHLDTTNGGIVENKVVNMNFTEEENLI